MERVFDSYGRQIYTCLCCNLLSFAFGTSVGWANANLPSLETNQTTLDSGPISKDGRQIILSLITISFQIFSFSSNFRDHFQFSI